MSEGDLIRGTWLLDGSAAPDVSAEGPVATPSGVTTPSQWLLEAMGGAATSGSVRVSSWTALTSSPIAAAIRILAEDIAKLPIRLYKTRASRGRTEVRDHPVARLLAIKPNRWMTPFDFKACMVSQYALNGNAVALINRDAGGRPTALVPIETPRVALWEADGELWYHVSFSSDIHRVEYNTTGALFPPADVLHIKWPISWQGLWGYSPVMMARETIANAITLDRYAGNLYANYADVGGVLKHPGRLGDEALARLRKQWESRYAGNANKGRTAILEEGMSFEKMSMTAQDAEFVLNRKFSVEEVARIYRIPPHKLMDLTRTIQSNIEEQSKSYIDDTLGPIIYNFEDAYTDKLLMAREPTYLDIEHDVSAFVRGRPAERWDYHIKAILHGVMTPNEVRIIEGMDPATGGDEYYRSNNMVPRDAPIEPDQGQRQRDSDEGEVLRRFAERMRQVSDQSAPFRANGHG